MPAVAADLGTEQELPGIERRRREVVVVEARAGLQDADAVTLLGQPQRGDGSAEAGPDDQDVEVVAAVASTVLVHHRGVHLRRSLFMTRRWAVIALA